MPLCMSKSSVNLKVNISANYPLIFLNFIIENPFILSFKIPGNHRSCEQTYIKTSLSRAEAIRASQACYNINNILEWAS